jgi:hypothetical protein
MAVRVTAENYSWIPFKTLLPHIFFDAMLLDYNFDKGPSSSSGTSETDVTFYTIMHLSSITIPISFSYTSTETKDSSSSSTTTTLTIGIESDPASKLTLLGLIEEFLHGFKFPDEAREVFDISLQSLAITYSSTSGAKNNDESFTFVQSGGLTLVGVQVSAMSIAFSKQKGSWTYSASFTLPTPAHPLDGFLTGGIPGLRDLTINDGFLILSSGAAGVSMGGKLMLEGNPFMEMMGAIVKIPEMDFTVSHGGQLIEVFLPSISITLSIAGQKDIFEVSNFRFRLQPEGFSLVAQVALQADWFAPKASNPNPISFDFLLQVDEGEALGIAFDAVPSRGSKETILAPDASFIVDPFHIPGLTLYPLGFRLVWNIAEEEPQAIAAHGGFKIGGTQDSANDAVSLR